MQTSAWTKFLEDCKVGCFILDLPMGLRKNSSGWSLRDIMQTINVIDQSFQNEYNIILYSMHDMAAVQEALTQDPVADGKQFTVSRFVIAKVFVSSFHVYPSSYPSCLCP